MHRPGKHIFLVDALRCRKPYPPPSPPRYQNTQLSCLPPLDLGSSHFQPLENSDWPTQLEQTAVKHFYIVLAWQVQLVQSINEPTAL